MKTIYLTMTMVVISFTTVFAQAKTEKFEVKGNCGMCETRIEKAANSVEGFSDASWDKKTQMLTVKKTNAEADVMKVHKAVAKVGHDTEKVKADDSVYKELPACCKYDRTEIKKEK